jgi:hypothetical protein
MVYRTGEKPGIGTYRCENGHDLKLDDDTDTLPPCSTCNSTKFTKL